MAAASSLASLLVVLALAGCAGAGPEAAPPTPGPWPVAYGPAAPPMLDPVPPAGPALDPMRFGFDVGSVGLQAAAGLTPDFATLWIGVWNLEKGWRVPDAELAALRDANITPAVHLYYWGDDIAPRCFEAGCNGKTVAGWERLVLELGDHLRTTMGGDPVLVVLETEFNKGSVARHEPLDALLAAQAERLKAEYPAAHVVLGFGNWNLADWGTWDRAVAASDAVGVQALTGTARPAGGDAGLFDATLAGVRHLRELFGKPVIVQDVAVPSGPHPATPATQAAALAPFAEGLADLKEEGVEAILYRAFTDNPEVPLDRYFGAAERHFGLAADGTGELKPAGVDWVGAVRSERGEAPPTRP